MRILLAEPNPEVRQTIELALQAKGYVVSTAPDAEEALAFAKSYDFDLIVTELGFHDWSGFELIKLLRLGQIETPVMVLTIQNSTADRVRALQLGADDYVTKPVHFDEMDARIKAIVRRSKGHSRSAVEIGKLEIDLDSKVVTLEGARVPLTGKEYAMLECMALRRSNGAPVSKEMFLSAIYGGRDEPELKIIDVFICKLRKKFEAIVGPDKQYIATVWGRGYHLVDAEAAYLKQQGAVAA